MYLYTLYIILQILVISEEEVSDISSELYFVFGSIIQSLQKLH